MKITNLQQTTELYSSGLAHANGYKSNELLFQYDTNTQQQNISKRKMKDSSVTKLPTGELTRVFGRNEAKELAKGCTPEDVFDEEELEWNGFENQKIEKIENNDGSVSYIIPRVCIKKIKDKNGNEKDVTSLAYKRMDIKENSDGSKIVGIYPLGGYSNKNDLFHNKDYFPIEYRVIKNNLCYERYIVNDNGYANKQCYEFAKPSSSNFGEISY